MKTSIYLVIKRGGSVRVNKSSPKLSGDEIAMPITLNIPDKIFEKPFLKAEITIPEDVIPQTPLNATVVNNVSEAIKTATGLEFSITVEGLKEEEK